MVKKVVILAGGYGSRLSEETDLRPKPLVEIGNRPILWHIMRLYSTYGLNDFIICLGYKGDLIKQYFTNYHLYSGDMTVNLRTHSREIHHPTTEPWRVTLADTGLGTQTGGRLKRIQPYLGEEDFCLAYGDGVGDIDIEALLAFHKRQGRLATVTAVRPPARFGALRMENGLVQAFEEKPPGDDAWINGGFFVLSPKVLDYIESDETAWEREPLRQLVQEEQLASFVHQGFWHPMDTLRDKRYLNECWDKQEAPWAVWERRQCVAKLLAG